MSHAWLPQFLMRVFAPRRTIDFFVKPLATLTVYLLTYALCETLLMGWTPDRLEQRLLAITMAQTPFLIIAFILVAYLDRLQSGLADLAMTDALTDLPNRRAFIEKVSEYQRRGDTGFLLIIDADHFKQINDTYGHAIGDICLKAIAARLRALQTQVDVIGRIGGEEFGAYLPYCTGERLLSLGAKLCSEIAVPHPDSPALLRFTLSAGSAETKQKEPVETALARADEALYAAKNAGRGRLIVWRKSLSDAA